MTNVSPPSVSSYTARNLSFKQLEAWSAAGASHRDELQRIVKEIVRSLHHSSSPAKTLSAAMRKLETLFSRSEVRGEVHLHNNRHINFRLAFPTRSDEGLVFCLLYGEINARTGAVKFDLTRPIQMSLHALQRLFERMEGCTDATILDEIYSCIGQVIFWHKGATEVNAKCWPLMSKNGFFIGTALADSKTTVVVTWIKNGRIGKKWGLPLNNLTRLKDYHPERFEDSEFATEFLRSFPWMLHEHVPGEDIIALAWEQREDEENSVLQDEPDLEDHLSTENSGLTNASPKLSFSYISGLNYTENQPPFKTHTLHIGVVVQKRRDGRLVVGLKNGWVGQIPRRAIERGFQLIPNYIPPEIGDDIPVLVHKIIHYPNENAFSVSLDPKEISDANWVEVEKSHPIGSCFSATLGMKFSQEFIAQLDNGIRGVIPASEVQIYMSQPGLYGSNSLGQIIDVVVTGFRSEKKCLLFSIKNIESIPDSKTHISLYKVGGIAVGKCIRSSPNYALIELPPGVYGLLHKLNNWGRELPKVGQDISVVVAGSDDSQIILAGEPPRSLGQVFYAMPLSADRWEKFIHNFSVGDSVEVQTLYWRESNQSYMVVTSDGIVGSLPGNEVDWFCVSREEQNHLLKPGDIIKVKISKIHPTKSILVFSKKALDKYPMDEQLSKIDLEESIQGMVVNVLDYGCFVHLQPYGLQALLHRSKIPEGKNFIKGDYLNVRIDAVDHVKKRISIRLA